MLQQQSSSVDLPDGSCYFIGAQHPIYPGDVCSVLGKFMPQDPHVFYVAYGRMERPWIYLLGYCLFVTLGPLLHHERDFSFYRAHTIISEDDRIVSPLLTFIVPHYIDTPYSFPISLLCLYQHSDRAELADLLVPEVAPVPPAVCTWQRNVVTRGPSTVIQAAVADRLQQSWGLGSVSEGNVEQEF